jgi:hypothetical protein
VSSALSFLSLRAVWIRSPSPSAGRKLNTGENIFPLPHYYRSGINTQETLFGPSLDLFILKFSITVIKR